MKTVRKLTTLLLVLAMIFSVSVSAFAAPASTATLVVSYYGYELLDPSPVTLAITSGMTAKDALDQYISSLTPIWRTVSYPNTESLDYVIDTISGISNDPIGAASGIPAQFWSTAYPGYGIEYTETVNGETVYHFIYVGEEWRFTVNGNVPMDCTAVTERFFPESFMNRYLVQPGDVLSVSYELFVHRWTGTTNFLQPT